MKSLWNSVTFLCSDQVLSDPAALVGKIHFTGGKEGGNFLQKSRRLIELH